VDNNTLTRIRFTGCTNSNIPNSTAQTPPQITYNAPGVYNINLSVDDGLPTQTAYCKQVVVTSIDSVRIRDSAYGCTSFDFKGFGYSYPINTWQWDFGDGALAPSQKHRPFIYFKGTYTVKLAVSDIMAAEIAFQRLLQRSINQISISIMRSINAILLW
jgi:PKD repeat protein